MIKLTSISGYVTCDCAHLGLLVKSISDLTDDDNKLTIPDKSHYIKESIDCLIRCISAGLTPYNLIGEHIPDADSDRKAIIVYLIEHYATWRDNEKVKTFVADLCINLFDTTFVFCYINGNDILIEVLSSIVAGGHTSLDLTTNVKTNWYGDRIMTNFELFVNCSIDKMNDSAIWQVL